MPVQSCAVQAFTNSNFFIDFCTLSIDLMSYIRLTNQVIDAVPLLQCSTSLESVRALMAKTDTTSQKREDFY